MSLYSLAVQPSRLITLTEFDACEVELTAQAYRTLRRRYASQ